MTKPTPGNLRENASVCEILRDDILSLAIAPGSALEEKVLAEKYQVSRTPIREAFIRLAAEGLVEFRPRRGARVIPIILPNLPRYLETSSLIHRSLSRLAAERRHKRDLSQIDAAVAALSIYTRQIDIHDYETVLRAASGENAVLHAVAEGAHNEYLLEIFEKLRLQGQRMLRLAFCYCPAGQISVPDFAAQRVQSLAALAGYIRQGDADAAEAQSQQLHSAMVGRLMAYLSEDLTDGIRIDAAEGADTVEY